MSNKPPTTEKQREKLLKTISDLKKGTAVTFIIFLAGFLLHIDFVYMPALLLCAACISSLINHYAQLKKLP